jgi:hypothetical protein
MELIIGYCQGLYQKRNVRIQVIEKAVKPILGKHLGELCQNTHSH